MKQLAAVLLSLVIGGVGASVFAGDARTNQAPQRAVSSDGDVGLIIKELSPGHPIVIAIERYKDHSNPSRRDVEIPESLARQSQTNYAEFSSALVAAAEHAKLDSASLAKILELVRGAKENKGLAVVPVAAHATRRDGELVWVVSLRWEGEKWVSSDGDMSHFSSFTFTQKTLRKVAFDSCD